MKRAIKYIMRQNASNCLLGTRFSFLAGGGGGWGGGKEDFKGSHGFPEERRNISRH